MTEETITRAIGLPASGQAIEIEPAEMGTGYTSTVIHSSPTMYVLVDLPPLGTPVSLQTPRNSKVFARFKSRDGSPITWSAIVRSFGNWGVGLLFERQLVPETSEVSGIAPI